MIAVVVPTCRPDRFAEWLDRWGRFESATVYVVEDGPRQTFDAPIDVRHLCWPDIDRDLGKDAWIIPRQTDCVRSYGYLQAWRDGADTVITMDDDCYPVDGVTARSFVDAHVNRLAGSAESDAWVSTLNGDVKPRGVPYRNTRRATPCYLSHGLWQNVADLDAVTTLDAERRPTTVGLTSRVIPPGRYFPMCGMNLAWRREMTPAIWFGLQGQPAWPYDRFGDIWAGLFVKRICDHLGFGVWSGGPHVWHDRASNTWANLRKEAPGMELNDTLWRHVDAVRLTATTVAGCYVELADGLQLNDPYWLKARKAMRVWAALTT